MCAIFGIVGNEEAANWTYLGLHALQHRGQEGAGIVSADEGIPYDHRQLGLVGDVFSSEALEKLKGSAAIGHTRYSTSGSNTLANLQPLLMNSHRGWCAIAHNGNLVNAAQLTEELERNGSIFHTTNDTEVILHLVAKAGKGDLETAVVEALRRVEGAYSILMMSADKFIAVRDPHGFRPLILGRLKGKSGDAFVFASETSAFDLIGATYEREIEPGEMVTISLLEPSKLTSTRPFAKKESKRCVFEYVYFAKPDSLLFNSSVYETRKRLGRRLAAEQPAPGADVVIPIPDSGVPAAIGYAEATKLPFDMGIIRSHYIGRTFIEPQQSIRNLGVRLKLSPVKANVRGKSVVVIDDSLVRGTTSKKIIQHLRDAGAKAVHMRISAPPTTNPCYYGIDTPTRAELVASTQSVAEVCKFVGADSLGYLSVEGLLKEASEEASAGGFCQACFTGDYPTPL